VKTLLTIRELAASDLPQVAPLLAELGYPVDEQTLRERFTQFTAQGENAIVAERDAQIIGLLTLHVTPVLHRPGSVGRITTLVVAGSAQDQGVGRALMNEAEGMLWTRGCVLIEVTSNIKRSAAHAFYEKLGYEKTSYRFGKVRPSAM
jgi:ribosomal protein S18 acetylase RimI-like enzyme